jgi:hypothetical protein
MRVACADGAQRMVRVAMSALRSTVDELNMSQLPGIE